MQPRIIDPRSASQRMAQAIAGNNPNARNENPNQLNSNERNNVQPTDRLQGRFQSNPYGSNTDTSEQTFGGNASRDDFSDENNHTEVHWIKPGNISFSGIHFFYHRFNKFLLIILANWKFGFSVFFTSFLLTALI